RPRAPVRAGGQPAPARRRPRRVPHQEPARPARHRRWPRCSPRRHHRGSCRLLLRGHEQARHRHHRGQRRHGRRREHDVGPRAREGRRLAIGGRHRLRRAPDHRRQRLGALRHLAQRPRHRRQGLRRPHVGLHGAGRQPGGAGRCRRRARRLHLRGAPLRARQGEEPRLRLHREGHARGAQGSARRTARGRGARGRHRRVGVPPLRLRPQALQFPRREPGVLLMSGDDPWIHTPPRESAIFDRHAIAEIHRAAATGIYDIRGFGAKRKLPHFDDLLFLGASMSRYPLEGYRERCGTDVTLGTRHARRPITLKIPITIAGMSFGSLSAPAKEALGRGATAMGTSTTTGDGGMTPDERRAADAIEVVVGQGAKPGGGGMLLGQKISDRIAQMRNLPKGIDQRSACRHPDWTGPDDLEIKIEELREITDWEKPIYVKVGASRPYYDIALAVKAGADAVVLDGMQGGTAATQDVFIEHVGIPTLAAIPPAVKALQDLGMHRKVQLIVSGGVRNGADVAKCLALGADAVSVGTAALIAIGDNDPHYEEEYRKLGTRAGAYDDWHEGRDPAGITTQDPELTKRVDPVLAGRRLANYLKVMTLEAQTIARACGKNHLHNLEPEDLVALTVEAAAMARVPLAGTEWIPGSKASL